MKKSFLIILLSVFTLSLYSCRETEMNTDGNMEETETGVEETGEEIE